jgi:hypothetical protein
MKGTAGYNNDLEGTLVLRVEATNPDNPSSVTPTPWNFNFFIKPDCTMESIDFPTAMSPTLPITYTSYSTLSITLNDWTYRTSCGVEYYMFCKCKGDPYNPYTSSSFSWTEPSTSAAFSYNSGTSAWSVSGDVGTSNSLDQLVAFDSSTRIMTIHYGNNRYTGSTPIQLELWATNSHGITPVMQTLDFIVTEDCNPT